MKKIKHNAGTLMIWTVLFGLLLSSVYFSVATRGMRVYGDLVEAQKTKDRQDYLESYAEVLMGLDLPTLENLSSIDLPGEGISGTLTNLVSAITGILDHGESDSFNLNEPILIQWNQCNLNEKGDLLLNGETLEYHRGNCSENQNYADTISLTPTGTLTLHAITEPFHYQIVSEADNTLRDKKWHLSLSLRSSQGGKTLNLEKTFTPE